MSDELQPEESEKHEPSPSEEAAPSPEATGDQTTAPPKAEEVCTLPVAEVEALRKAARDRDELSQKYLRLLAEFSNHQRRVNREKEELGRVTLERFLRDLIPVLDDVEAGLGCGGGVVPDAVLEALRLLQAKIDKALTTHGVEFIRPEGPLYDPGYHEAIEVLQRADLPDMSIVEVVRRGYALSGRVIRPALVKVSRKPEEKSDADV